MQPAPWMSVGLLDESEVVVAGLSAMLEGSDIGVVAIDEAGGREAVVDVYLWDPLMHPDGLSLLSPARREHGLAAYTWSPGDPVVRGVGAGGMSVVDKASGAFALAATLRRIGGGECVVAPGRPHEREVPRVDCGLTRRETEVVQRVACGMTNRLIAADLGVARSTVRGHLRSAYAKTGSRSRGHAVLWAVAHGLGRPGHLSG